MLEVVEIAVTAPTTGYIAIGFTDGRFHMAGSEAVVGWADSTSSYVAPYALLGTDQSSVVGHPSMTLTSMAAVESDGKKLANGAFDLLLGWPC